MSQDCNSGWIYICTVASQLGLVTSMTQISILSFHGFEKSIAILKICFSKIYNNIDIQVSFKKDLSIYFTTITAFFQISSNEYLYSNYFGNSEVQ